MGHSLHTPASFRPLRLPFARAARAAKRGLLSLRPSGGAGTQTESGEPALKAKSSERHLDGSSLLCENEATRRRLLDMERHIYPARLALFASLAVTLLALGPWVGWWPAAPLSCAAIGFQIADHRMPRSSRPEYWIMGAWAFSQLMIGMAVIFTGGPNSLFLAWLAIPAATLAARFSTRGVVAGASWTVLVLLVATVGVHWGSVAKAPQRLLVPLSLLIGVTLLSTALMRSDMHHRAAASVDTLSGLFNRQALTSRATELLEQARAAAMPLSLLIGDLDHFKPINDGHGHLVGDEVLRDIAQTLRTTLRTFDYVFRYGGEEFVILLPGKHQEDAVAVAERLRKAIAESRPVGIEMTMSFGVGSTEAGEATLEDLLASADRALYAAKSEGRDCVRSSGVVKARSSTAGQQEAAPRVVPQEASAPAAAEIGASAVELARKTFLDCRRVDVDELALDLGVTPATIAKSCGEREQLLGRAIGSLCVDLLHYVERKQAQPAPQVTMLTIYTEFMKLLVNSRPLQSFLQREPQTALRVLTSGAGEVQPRIVKALEETLERHRPAGDGAAEDVDLHNLAYAVVRLSEGFLYHDSILATEPQVQRAVEVVSLLLH